MYKNALVIFFILYVSAKRWIVYFVAFVKERNVLP